MDIPDIDTRKISIDELKKIKYYIRALPRTIRMD